MEKIAKTIFEFLTTNGVDATTAAIQAAWGGVILRGLTLLAAGILVLVAALLLFRKKPKIGDLIALAAVIAGLVFAWNGLRPRQTPLMDEAQMVQDMIGQGLPVLLEFQSPY